MGDIRDKHIAALYATWPPYVLRAAVMYAPPGRLPAPEDLDPELVAFLKDAATAYGKTDFDTAACVVSAVQRWKAKNPYKEVYR